MRNKSIGGLLPPQAIEIETAVIGACLSEPETFDSISHLIHSPEIFYQDANQKIWEAMQHLSKQKYAIDLLTVIDQLGKLGNLEVVGGAYALTMILSSVVSSAHVEDHARIVVEKFNLRELIRICSEKISVAYSDVEDSFELLEETEKAIRNITDGISSETSTQVGESYAEMIMEIEEMKINPVAMTGIDTGYKELNEITNGWQKSELIILAARPSQGKTAFALNLAINAACSTVSPCGTLVFSLEASKMALIRRMAASKNDVNLSDIRAARLTPEQDKKMIDGIRVFQNMKLRIDDKSQNLSKIIAAIRREKKKRSDLGLVIIDYLQLIRGAREKNGNREQEIANISRELKLLATELEISIIALSQLNRETERQGGKKPGLHNLRESGAIEQDANIVMFIWHDESPDGLRTWILVEKNRDGACKPVELNFAKDIQRWVSMEDVFEQLPQHRDNPRAGFQNVRAPYKPDVDDVPF